MSFLSLGLVCLLAYAALRWLSKRGQVQGQRGFRVLARCAVEPKRSLVVVDVAGRVFLLSSAEGGLSLVAELDAKDAERLMAERQPPGSGLWGQLKAGTQPAWPSRGSPAARETEDKVRS